MSHVIGTSESAGKLREELEKEGYRGPEIIYGRRVNKLHQLLFLQNNGVKVPSFYLPGMALKYPVVGRRDYHEQGSGFFVCEDERDYEATRRYNRPPTHYVEFLSLKREFRGHIVDNLCINLLEKVPVGRYVDGASHYVGFADTNGIKEQLRSIAKAAVRAVGYDFGAVDVLMDQKGSLYVSEVNSAPCLTMGRDTLDRYVAAFMEREPLSSEVAPIRRVLGGVFV